MRSLPRSGVLTLCAELSGINKSALMRSLATLGEETIRFGTGRRTRYALRRHLCGKNVALLLFRIDADSIGHDIGILNLIHSDSTVLTHASAWRNRADYPRNTSQASNDCGGSAN